MENRDGITEGRRDGVTEPRNYGETEVLGSVGPEIRESLNPEVRESVGSEIRESVGPEVRESENRLRPLMTDSQKSEAKVLELSYDFACRIIRMYKFLNEGKKCKADRDVIGALGMQLLRAATSINANLNEAQHPQSDADFLSKASIALKESRESETWLHMLSDNGYLSTVQAESLLNDCGRINRILITITSKVRKRLNG